MTLGWLGDKVSVEVRDKAVLTLQSKELGSALFNLFLGTQVRHHTPRRACRKRRWHRGTSGLSLVVLCVSGVYVCRSRCRRRLRQPSQLGRPHFSHRGSDDARVS